MRKICPNCGGKKFLAEYHVVQQWLVDECGICLDVVDDFIDIQQEALDTDVWRCAECGYMAEGRKFNVEE